MTEPINVENIPKLLAQAFQAGLSEHRTLGTHAPTIVLVTEMNEGQVAVVMPCDKAGLNQVINTLTQLRAEAEEVNRGKDW